MTEAASAAVAQSFLTVQVGDERFALPASDVAEVIRPPAVTRVPLGPSSLLGVANLRGAVMPVVSLHRLLGGKVGPSSNARVVVIDRGTPVGLMIDKVTSLGEAGVASPDSTADDGMGKPARVIDLDALLAKDFGSFTRRAQLRQVEVATNGQYQTSAEQNQVALVCFAVAGQDFALPLTAVREVVALPDGVAVVPQTDSVMLGVTSLRGQLLPLVSLRALLGLRAGGQGGGRSRVVVARFGQGLVGLAIDGMKEILRLPASSIDPVPAILTRGNAEAQIQGICRLEGGRRLVSLLSTDHLFSDQALFEQIISQTGNNHDMGIADGPSSGDEQFIVFQLGGEEYGLPIGAVDEVVRVPDTLTRVPKAPAFIEGVMSLRGQVVPVIDQRRRFKFERQGERRRERIVVVRIDQMQAGFVVDAVSEVLSLPQNQLRPTPELAADGSQVIDRIANIEVEGRMVLLLDPRKLLDKAEKDLLAAMGDPERPAS
ncbi:chemotaxis protein CheW [Microvirga terrestris]|uniref:Chemotaxis protein CheW n=1 Tax=Microvirga terrestris TaxID=2791024 RepID=A0ABS0HX00_9HYPH|nr:chemotaxis protein CheW [Microvirga terrestris]MBF9198021.1 chemotaxis protein CheW [Microvirga terrestris]